MLDWTSTWLPHRRLLADDGTIKEANYTFYWHGKLTTTPSKKPTTPSIDTESWQRHHQRSQLHLLLTRKADNGTIKEANYTFYWHGKLTTAPSKKPTTPSIDTESWQRHHQRSQLHLLLTRKADNGTIKEANYTFYWHGKLTTAPSKKPTTPSIDTESWQRHHQRSQLHLLLTRKADNGTIKEANYTFYWHGKSSDKPRQHGVGSRWRTRLSATQLNPTPPKKKKFRQLTHSPPLNSVWPSRYSQCLRPNPLLHRWGKRSFLPGLRKSDTQGPEHWTPLSSRRFQWKTRGRSPCLAHLPQKLWLWNDKQKRSETARTDIA